MAYKLPFDRAYYFLFEIQATPRRATSFQHIEEVVFLFYLHKKPGRNQDHLRPQYHQGFFIRALIQLPQTIFP